MLTHIIPAGIQMGTGLAFHSPSNCAWATAMGTVFTTRLLDGEVLVRATDYSDLVAAIPLRDSLTAVLVERNGEVWAAAVDDLTKDQASLVTQLAGPAVAGGLHPDSGAVLVLTNGAPGQAALSAVAVEDGTVTPIAAGLESPIGLTVDPDARTATVAVQPGDGSSALVTINLDDGSTSTVPGLPGTTALITAPAGGLAGTIVATQDDASPGRLTLVDPAGVAGVGIDLGRPVTALTRWGSAVIAASGSDLIMVEWLLEEGEVPIATGLGPLAISGYRRLYANPAAAGLRPGDLRYSVREGPTAGSISAGVEPAPSDGTEMIMLLAGPVPGEYHLDATRVADGRVVASRRFRVTGTWPDPDVGPPVVAQGEQRPYHLMSWGGSGALAGANIGQYIKKTPNEWRVLVLLVSTTDRRWGGLEVAAKQEWRDRLLGGPVSARRYYEEVSGYLPGAHGMTVSLVGGDVLGPIDLPYGWGDLFERRVAPNETDPGWSTQNPKGTDVLAAAASTWMARREGGQALLMSADSVVCIVRSGSDPMKLRVPGRKLSTRYAWGHARWATFYEFPGLEVKPHSKPITVMADASPATSTAGDQTHILIHELGHNLGMADLYDSGTNFPAEINARHPSGLDLMATTGNIPRLSLGHLVGLGWVPDNWVRSFDFSKVELGDSLILQSTESLGHRGPSPGHVAGIDIRIGAGWSYLFEYRRRRFGQVADQRLDAAVGGGRDRLIVGMDMRVIGRTVPRPPIIALAPDVDGDGPKLVREGQNYRDNDATNRDRMFDFSVTLDDLEDPVPNTANVTVSYTGARRAQLMISPGGTRGNFKSADIWLENPVNQRESVIKGATNKIKITVHNIGLVDARNVRLHVAWLPYTVSPGAWTPLPDPFPVRVRARSRTEVVVNWPVPASVKVNPSDKDEANHFCVGVRIEGFTDALHPENDEVVLGDNWAQSNFADDSVPFGSPSTRLVTTTAVSNPLPESRVYEVEAAQSTEWYRVYVGHRWLRLQPGETRSVEVAYESLAGDAAKGAEFEQQVERITSTEHHVALIGYLLPEGGCAAPVEVGGANLVLRAGRRCWFTDLTRQGERLSGQLLAQSNDVVFPPTFGEVNFAGWLGRDPTAVFTATAPVAADGTFALLIPQEIVRAVDVDGERVFYVVCRPDDNVFALALTPPEVLT